MSDLVELASYATSLDANLAKIYLESEGIESVLFDEGVNSVCANYGVGAVPVRLMVLDADLEEASRLLRDYKP